MPQRVDGNVRKEGVKMKESILEIILNGIIIILMILIVLLKSGYVC